MNSLMKGRFSKLVLGMLIAGLLLQPAQQVLAAEVTEGAQETLSTTGLTAPESEIIEPIGNKDLPTPQEGEEKTDEPAGDSEEDTEEEPKDELAEEEQESEEEELSPEGIPEPPVEPTVQLPQTTIKQKIPDADIASGALTYSYDFQVPSGRGGLQPDVSLNYNSQQNEEGSLAGFGWGLSIPTIERKNVDGLNNMYASDNFSSTLSGDLKKTGSSNGVETFGAKIDNGGYLKYSFDESAQSGGGVWTVQDKTGMTYTFGTTAESRLSNPTDATQVFRWHLTKVQDSKGNFISYEYAKIDNQVYPSVVRYTGNGSDQGIFRMEFVLEDRPDDAISAKYGYMIKTTKRISEVKAFVQNTLVGKYVLGYEQQSVNGRSLLSNVEYTGYDASGANAISDGGINFEYNSIAATNLLSKIIQNTGGVTEVTYKSSAQYRDGSGAALNPNLPFAVYTVEKIEYDDRNGVTWDNNFEYAGGWFYYNGPMDRRFVGFEKVSRTDSAGSVMTTFYHQGNGNNTVYAEVNDDWAKSGKSYKSELRDSNGNLFTQILNKWEFDRLAGTEGADARSFVKLSANVTRTFDGNTSHKDKASTYSYDDETGNLVSGIDYGEVTATDSGSFTDIGTDKITSTVSYAEPTTNTAISGLPSRLLEVDQSSSKIKETKTYYDGLAFGEVGIGNVTKEENWVAGSIYAAVNRTFNSYGLPLTETDPLSNTTTYTYDSFNLYPVTVTNALNQETDYEYDYRIGKPVKTIDPNGLVAKATYDGLGRPLKEEYTRPDQSNPEVLYTKKVVSYELYQQSSEVRGWKTVETNYLDDYGAATPRENKTVTYTDGFDRPVQVRALVESADGSSDPRYSVIDTAYNNIAQIEKTSLPYFSIGDSRTAATTTLALYTVLTYDAAQRVLSTTNEVGATVNVYDDWSVTVTDANGKVKGLKKDAYDRLIEVEEHNDTEVYETEYTYDATGNLIKIVDALDNEREFEYDGIGRRTLAEDLHTPSDTTFGVWTYQYDLAGNLVYRLDANGEETTYGYDALNRQIYEDAGLDPAIEVNYVYDECTNGIGRLCSSVSSAITTAYEYDILGQIIQETKTIDSQDYITEYSYDRQGNQLLVTNPDGSEVKYAYNIGGAIESVQSKEDSASNFGNVVVDMDYAPTGAVAYQENANGSVTTNTYDSSQLYRLISKVTTVPTSSGTSEVQNLSYEYDAVGNILNISDSISTVNGGTGSTGTGKSINYGYDDLHRLVYVNTLNAVSGDDYSHIYEYDAIGNITYRSDVGTFEYKGNKNSSYANPHAVTHINDGSTTVIYDYDQNGNMLSDAVQTYEWDYNNRLAKVTQAGGDIEYAYSVDGMRIKVSNRGGTTVYPTQFYNTSGALSGAEVQKHVFAGDTLAATIKGSGSGAVMSVVHSDHLGSTTVISDASGGVTELLDYYPFGGIRFDNVISGTTEQRKYIGQEYDVDTGLNYLEARYYNGQLGRFLSQDIVHLSLGDVATIKTITDLELQEVLTDPQGYNSYSYARNNPLNGRDSNGQWLEKIIGEKATIAVGNWATRQYENNAVAKYAMDHPYQAGAIAGVVGGALIAGGVVAAGGAITCGAVCGSTVVAGSAAAQAVANPRNQQTVTNIYNTAVNNVLSRNPTAGPNIPPRADIIRNFNFWANTSFGTKTESMIYHNVTHPQGGNLDALTRNAHNVWNSYVSNQGGLVSSVNNVTLKNGDIGIKIKLMDGTGGIFTNAGKIVTSFYD